MTAASNYLENKILDHVLRVASFTQPSGLWLALFTGNPGESGSFANEIATSGSAYARQTITFASASGGVSANDATVTFPVATSSWGTITHVAIVDNATRGSGNVLYYSAVTVAKTIGTSDQFQITTGNLTISLD